MVEVPTIAPGAVLHWRLPLQLPADAQEVRLEVVAALDPKAERVRPAWKLLDTIVQPTPADPTAPMGLSTAAAALGTWVVAGPVLAGAVILAGSRTGTGGTPGRREPNRSNLEFLSLPVLQAQAPLPLLAAEIEEVWRPGLPLPERSSVQQAPAAASAGDRCSNCGAVAPQSAEFCSSCLCALPRPPSPGLATTPPAEPTPVVAAVQAACPRHPSQQVLGPCTRCGGFLCQQCLAPEETDPARALCPDCRATREARERPEEEKKAFQGLGTGLGVFGLASTILLSLIAVRALPKDPSLGALVLLFIGCAVLHAPLAICAVITSTARSLGAGWFGLALEGLLLLGWLLVLKGVSLYLIFLIAVFVVGVLQALRAKSLRADKAR